MKRTPPPGRQVSVTVPPPLLLQTASALASAAGYPLKSGACETNAHYLASAAIAAGHQAEIVMGYWVLNGQHCTHAWVRIDGADFDPSATLCGHDPARVSYLERISCSDEEAEEVFATTRQSLLQELVDEHPYN